MSTISYAFWVQNLHICVHYFICVFSSTHTNLCSLFHTPFEFKISTFVSTISYAFWIQNLHICVHYFICVCSSKHIYLCPLFHMHLSSKLVHLCPLFHMRFEFKTYTFVSTISYAFCVQNLHICVHYFTCIFDAYSRSLQSKGRTVTTDLIRSKQVNSRTIFLTDLIISLQPKSFSFFSGSELISWFQTFAVFCTYYVFFLVVPRRLNYICRRFGTLYLLHLHRPMPMKMEQIECAYEDGTDRVFRNVGIYNWDAGELPKRKHNILEVDFDTCTPNDVIFLDFKPSPFSECCVLSSG